MGDPLGAAGPHRRQHSAKEALWAGAKCVGLKEPMRIDAKGRLPATAIVLDFRSRERKLFACPPAASLRRNIGAQCLPQGCTGGASRLDDRTVENCFLACGGGFVRSPCAGNEIETGDGIMVKRTEPVKHAVTKAKDVVAKRAPLKRPEAKKPLPVAHPVKKAVVVDLTARVVRPEPAKAPEAAKDRAGRKPKSNEEQVLGGDAADALPEAGDDAVDPAVQVAEKLTPKQRAKDRRAKEKALKEALERSYHGTEEDLEARRNKLKALIKLGKERGFLTYAEINDHLPDNLVDAEAIDSIISTFGDMGIQVFDQAPDAETLLMNENVPAATTDDDVEEEAEAALTTVDAEFGRTTDPVRMYMREMGSVELLTREGEIEIAKRIEDGLKHMVMAISACPTTIAEILANAERIRGVEVPIDEVVDGLVDPAAEDFPTGKGAAASNEEEDEDEEGEDENAALSASLLQLKADALVRYAKINRLYEKMKRALAEHGHRSKEYIRVRDQIGNELMNIRFTARIIE